MYYGNNYGYVPMQYTQPNYPSGVSGINQYVPQQTYQSQPIMTYPIQNENESIGFIWVQGKEGAKAYPVAPNKTVLLMDSEQPFVYKKTADKDGKPTDFKIFKLVEQTESGENVETKVEYATKEDLQKLNNEIADIKETLLDIQTTPDPPKRTRRVS